MPSIKLLTYTGILLLLLTSSRLMAQEKAKNKTKVNTTTNYITVVKEQKSDFLHQYILNPKYKASTSNTTTKTKNTDLGKQLQNESSVAENVALWLKDKYSIIMDVMPDQIKNVMLYRFIDEWYGVRYRMGGTSKKGIDCSAFVQQLYKYAFGTNLLRTACLQFNSATYIKNKLELKEGDLVFFRIGTSRISHVGVYLRNNYFVHSASSKGVSIASLTSAYWSKYFAGGGRILQED